MRTTKTMKPRTISPSQGRYIYLAFTISGLLILLLAKDPGWAGIHLALAFAFNPYGEKSYSDLSRLQKAGLILQSVLALFLIGWDFVQVVSG
jgi:hypothetical protein